MPKYEDYPEQAETDRQRAQDVLRRLEDELTNTKDRSDEIEAEVDAAYENKDTAAQQAASQQLEKLQGEIEGLEKDAAAADEHLTSTLAFWGYI